jgi:C4-dicarboxylate-specific signal transduction histidine kinase
MGELAAGIAHELNQPLTTMALWAETTALTIERGTESSRQEQLKELKHLADQAHRAGEIVRRMRSLVRRAKPRQSTLHMAEVMDEILPLVQSDLRQEGVKVTILVGQTLPAIQADKVQVQQVLLNLIRNATEAMRDTPFEDRELAIRANSHDNLVEVTVCDTGCGVTPEAKRCLFEAFYSTKNDGMGMGLAVSRSIIEAHGGRIWATPNPDRGVTIHFTLPIGNP